jgi:RNA polymerase sigma factor (sigma-70 family)
MPERDDPPGQTSIAANDRELWLRATAGDESAFGELFERHVEAVWNHAYRLTGSWSRAEDLTSTTFLTAWRKRADVHLVHESARPWLFAVVANHARSEYRSGSRFVRALRRVPLNEVVDDHAERVAGQVDDSRRLRTVLAAVTQLPKAEREAVELCLVGGVSTADAAELLGLAEVTIRSRISRARARIRTLLEAQP